MTSDGLQWDTGNGSLDVQTNRIPRNRSPLMMHPTPIRTLLTSTLEPLILQLSSSLARGVRLIDAFLHHAPTPTTMMAFERELHTLLREVGRRIMAWLLNQLEPQLDQDAPAVVTYDQRLYRRRRQYPRSVATLFGTTQLRRRLYEPLKRPGRSIHPLEMALGLEAGLATPAMAEQIGRLSVDHTQHRVLEMLQADYGVHWSFTSLRKVLKSLKTGMASYRHDTQVERLLSWLEQARASHGRFRPTLSVGRDGIFVPLLHGVWQEGATATVSVLDRSGKRVGTVYLGQMPEPGQGTLTQQLSDLLHDLLTRVDSQSLRLVYVSDEGYHPSEYYHQVLKAMRDPRCPWRQLEWIRIVDFYHAGQYVQQLADAIFGVGDEAQGWSKHMRHQLKHQADGVSRVLKSASALRRHRGLVGQAKSYLQAYGYLKKRSQWMGYALYRRQKLPIGSGITEAACKVVFAQRLKRSGMSWTIEGGQTILDLRVIWLSGIWDEAHRRYLASKPLSVFNDDGRKGAQHGRLAA